MRSRQQPTDQAVLMVLTPIVPGDEAALRVVLADIATHLPPHAPAPDEGPIPFARLTTVHFARWVVFETMLDADGTPIPAELALGTAYDGPLDRHLRELVTVGRAGVDAIYAHCQGYPPPAERTEDAIVAYLLAHATRPAAAYVGARWRTVDQVRRETELRLALETELDRLVALPGPHAGDELYVALLDFVRGSEQFSWATDPPAAPSWGWWIRHWAGFVLRMLALVALLPILLPIVVVLFVLLRMRERDEGTPEHAVRPGTIVYADTSVELGHLQSLTGQEDFEVQNQMSLVSVVKPGSLRLLVLRLVLAYARFRVEYLEKQGLLGGVPSIHFAHWNIVDGGRRLVFFSNYDGTWESYLGDFIDHVAHALTGIWSNTIGFPMARWLVLDGAQNEQQFKAWTRSQQVPTDVWYAAYPNLSLLNVNNNTAIRAGFSVQPHGTRLDAWLRRF
jgi:hypothetical protein